MLQTHKTHEIRRALAEIWQNRAVFSQETLGQITLALLDRLRRVQTINLQTDPTHTMDEIRLVTVMFVDVKDSTQLAQQLESDWKGVLEEAHRRISTVISRYDGEVGQYLGDGVLCFFGAQRSRGDDAQRAVSCALAIQNAMETYANEFFLSYGLDFAIRIGISTGRVVVGMVGGGSKQELLALGPATNLAARLQGVAPPGATLIDAPTYARVRNAFVLKPRPPIKAKGYEQPITHYLLIERRNRPAAQLTQTEFAERPIPFVGRTERLEALQQLYQASLRLNKPQSALITGDLGIGKSRLLQEALNKAHEQGVVPISFIAQYELRNSPYSLLRYLLMSQCNLTDDMPLDEAQTAILEHFKAVWNDAQAIPTAITLAYLAGYGFAEEASVQAFLRSSQRSELAATNLARYVRAISEGNLPLLIVDNWQWVDAESHVMLTCLVRDWQEALVLVAAARSNWRENTTTPSMVLELRQLIPLERLSLDETAQLIEGLIGHIERLPATLKQQLNQRAEGNPLFVIEFVGMLYDSGAFHQDAVGKWRLNVVQYDSVVKNLPNGLVDILQARFDDLAPEARFALQAAAVAGQTFWAGMVKEILGAPQEATLEHLATRALIQRHKESSFENEIQYSFRHMLYRDVVYEMLPRAKREQYHRLAARWLVSRIHNKPEYYGALADQFLLGGQNEAALFSYLEAAQNRAQSGFYPEVLSLVDRGLAMAKTVPREIAVSIVAQLWTVRAQALIGMSRFEEASAAAQAALMLLQELPHDQLVNIRVQAARLRGNACRNLGLYDEALEMLSEAYELLDEDDNAAMSSVLRAFGTLMYYRGRLTDSAAYHQRAYQHALETQLGHHIHASQVQLGILAVERGDYAQGLNIFEQVRDANSAQNYWHFAAIDWRNIAHTYLFIFNEHRALGALEKASTYAEQSGVRDSLLPALRGICQIRIGNATEGLKQVWSALELPHRDVYSQQMLELLVVEALLNAGEYAACREQSLPLLLKTQSEHPLLYARTATRLARALHHLGDEQAFHLAQQALSIEAEHEGRELWIAYSTLAEVSASAEDALAYYQHAAEYLHAISANLSPLPDLQSTFNNAPQVRRVLRRARPTA